MTGSAGKRNFEIEGPPGPELDDRRKLAERVMKEFPTVLPELKLLIYLDDRDCPGIKEEAGAANRGVFLRVKRYNPLVAKVPHMRELLYESFDRPPSDDFDCAIYLHGSTCSNDIGLTMTLAHELQHFVQYRFARRAWAVSHLVQYLRKEIIAGLGFTWADVASEHEARLVAKRTTALLCGRQLTESYIDQRITASPDLIDANDWRFVRSLNTGLPFDLERHTYEMCQKLAAYRSDMAAIQSQMARGDPDFRFDLSNYFGTSAAATAG